MFELRLHAPEALVEILSDALMYELDALSVSVEDAEAGGEREHALFGEPGLPPPREAWQRSRVTALFADEAAARDATLTIALQAWGADVEASVPTAVEETDWVRKTQAQFEPMAITPTFWVVPSWHAPPAAATRVIRLDPGLAFGSGTHPTTRMCLRWISSHASDLVGARVLDYGCGSGILAIAAAMHGARSVDAVDIDPAAVTATHDNARANGTNVRVGDPALARGTYDIVLANILATPLKLLAPVLGAHRASPHGHLLLAGLLARQVDELREAYAPWCGLHARDEDDGWVLLEGSAAATR